MMTDHMIQTAQAPLTDGHADRRRDERTMVQFSTTAREPGRDKVRVQIVDLSSNGCRIEMLCNGFSEQWVLLALPGIAPLYSRIVWQEQGFAGLEFSTPLSEAVFRGLVEQTRFIQDAISALRSTGNRARHIAKRTVESPGKQALLELSRDCFLAAIVNGLEQRLVTARDARFGSAIGASK
jgi:hypothetical protein